MADSKSLHSFKRASRPLAMSDLESIYREHFRFVWRSLRRLGIAERDLPDAVHDVFLVVHKKLSSFVARAKVTTWIYGICLRTASDWRRSPRHTRELLGAPAEAEASDDASAEAEYREAITILDRLLGEMPLEQRAVFTSFELDGMSGEQIAELLELPIGTVWSRLRLARECFRQSVNRLRARDEFRAARPGVRP
jgi:RNA polymerase sigma-70 factor (ECF subfamily)